MVALKFASSHNMVAFLDKPTKSDGFKKIVDFLNSHPIKYALTVNPTIYTACIEQFWATTKVKTVNGEVQIQALVDKKKVVITETSIQRISLTGFPAQSIGSSNTDVLDSPCLLVLITGTSQSRQHVITSLIHIESCKSPTKSLFDVGSSRISIFTVNT
ncbi:hypothetical protein Tco_1173979 [Tanacetum coccineum]